MKSSISVLTKCDSLIGVTADCLLTSTAKVIACKLVAPVYTMASAHRQIHSLPFISSSMARFNRQVLACELVAPVQTMAFSPTTFNPQSFTWVDMDLCPHYLNALTTL